MTTGTVQLIVQEWFVLTFLEGNPFISVLQCTASAVMGNAAFEVGIATALFGVLLHFFTSLVIAGALLYGFGVVVVMNLTVLPLSGSGRRRSREQVRGLAA